MSTPHLTELLDMTAVVDEAVIALMIQAFKDDGEDVERDVVVLAVADLDPLDRLKYRKIALGIVYPAARVIAEQAYARAWDRARVLVDERTGEADATLGTLDQPGDDIPPGHVFELNPFAEGAVTV